VPPRNWTHIKINYGKFKSGELIWHAKDVPLPSKEDRLAQGSTNAEEALIHRRETCDKISERKESTIENMGNIVAMISSKRQFW